jgi:hypothetical protein
MTKQQRAAIMADGFVNHYHNLNKVAGNREGLRGDIADSDYFGGLAPTVAFVPDCLVIAWAEIWDDEVDWWMHILHKWRGRNITNATDLVRVFLASANGTARATDEAVQ